MYVRSSRRMQSHSRGNVKRLEQKQFFCQSFAGGDYCLLLENSFESVAEWQKSVFKLCLK